VGLDYLNLPHWLRPRKKLSRQVAVALGYKPGAGHAPEVLAKGFGHVAEFILEAARERNIPIREDADLAEVLARLDVGAEIPDELYEAIAEVLAFIYKMNARKLESASA
jgi:flagellar biosynthesis protein